MRFIAMLGLGLACVMALAQTGANNEPTLPETSQWIKEHFIGMIHTSVLKTVYMDLKHNPPREKRTTIDRDIDKVTSVDFRGCTVTIASLTTENGTDNLISSFTVPLDRITRVIWETTNAINDTNGDIHLLMTPEHYKQLGFEASNKIIEASLFLPQSKTRKVSTMEGVTFAIDDEEMGQRIYKAFDHAVALCHAKSSKEPF